ncbi:lytic transglycosylase [Octadecabacter sp. CECT 8868]|uniref:transglycosylase SLT domain-containing protein n=1 Tax=Octadecabacter algicola TaxID=2909342 RepID=UPI001F31762E|nr:transglycosylase SLT domain-containing protein [Octadecabacter algicola]MCF2906247.1 lytic transglycosylase [Octadecabacter algicola]
MSNFFRVSLLLLILGSCGARDGAAPRNLDNACAILTERPHYVRAFKQAERNWGVETHVLMAMIYQESKFISDNRPPHQYALGVIPTGRQSSALGYSQALDGTWDEYVREQGSRGSNRTNIADATDFMGWYMSLTVRENGIALDDTYNQYLAYHDGRTGWRRGTYRSKPWLVRIAGEVRDRAVMYDAQLRTCRQFR